MSDPKDTYNFRTRAQPMGLFETPIAYCQLQGGEEFLQDLEAIVRRRRDEDPGLSRSNIGGWHSDTRMLEWGGEPARKLGETVISIARRMTHFKESSPDAFDWPLQMWANVTPQGGMNDMHVHPGNLWAAVLYLDLGREADAPLDVGGNFFVEDPRFPMTVMRNTGMRLISADGNPQDIQTEFRLQRGDIVVFPAWLRHGVRPYKGSRERISIAVNIDAVPRQQGN
ncbi:MAG: TIGR02466 family protein [Gammaproteobacteria bacterium]|jgi:uncharacterized protein (TIGR02466 family)